MSACTHCGREFEGRGLGGHIIRCKQNPNRVHTNGLTGTKKTDAHRANLKVAMRRHFDANPHMIPYRLYHSSKRSYPEQLFARRLEEEGIPFKAEYQNGRYTYDFAFPECKLDVEIDGNTHTLPHVQELDRRRDEWSRSQGWTVHRIPAAALLKDFEAEFSKVKNHISPPMDSARVLRRLGIRFES